MNTALFDGTAGSLRPLGFTGDRPTVCCTPSAVDLAFVGLSAAGITYYASRAFYHRGGFEEERADLPADGRLTSDVLSVDGLVSVRTSVVARPASR